MAPSRREQPCALRFFSPSSDCFSRGEATCAPGQRQALKTYPGWRGWDGHRVPIPLLPRSSRNLVARSKHRGYLTSSETALIEQMMRITALRTGALMNGAIAGDRHE